MPESFETQSTTSVDIEEARTLCVIAGSRHREARVPGVVNAVVKPCLLSKVAMPNGLGDLVAISEWKQLGALDDRLQLRCQGLE